MNAVYASARRLECASLMSGRRGGRVPAAKHADPLVDAWYASASSRRAFRTDTAAAVSWVSWSRSSTCRRSLVTLVYVAQELPGRVRRPERTADLLDHLG